MTWAMVGNILKYIKTTIDLYAPVFKMHKPSKEHV